MIRVPELPLLGCRTSSTWTSAPDARHHRPMFFPTVWAPWAVLPRPAGRERSSRSFTGPFWKSRSLKWRSCRLSAKRHRGFGHGFEHLSTGLSLLAWPVKDLESTSWSLSRYVFFIVYHNFVRENCHHHNQYWKVMSVWESNGLASLLLGGRWNDPEHGSSVEGIWPILFALRL